MCTITDNLIMEIKKILCANKCPQSAIRFNIFRKIFFKSIKLQRPRRSLLFSFSDQARGLCYLNT